MTKHLLENVASGFLPLNFRAPETSTVMSWIKTGQSGCVIGFRGVGKTCFMRFLMRDDVRPQYLGPAWKDCTFVHIDLLALPEYTEWAFCELALDRLATQLSSSDTSPETIEEITLLHHQVTQSRDKISVRRAFERAIDALCQPPAQRLVLLLDEIDSVFQVIDPFLFRCLRVVRDAHIGQVSYILMLTDELTHLREDHSEVDSFDRLVSRNLCWLKPYDRADARYMLHYLMAQRTLEQSPQDTDRLIELTGGHAGFLKAWVSLLWNNPDGHHSLNDAASLLSEPAMRNECLRVWESLSEGERVGLSALDRGELADPPVIQRLVRKALLVENSSSYRYFSPLFAQFVHQQNVPVASDVEIRRSPRHVQIGGRSIATLTELEFEILCYLYEHRGRVCTKDDLIANVYHQQYDRDAGGVSDEALQTLMARLRAKLEPDPRHPRYIVTVRGEGYRFVQS